ncbi:uncharacterized protein LOC143043219 [Mytilus galloprovincialis]|uniref:uncharacterized protein LOC143043219 n=1 Tax=Mytilus galloprovincialis TaxID=29158 RepID=UPI003F7BB0FE
MWSIWIVALSLIHYGYILATDVKPNSCDIGDPLNDIFCGRNQQACPKGYHCQTSPFDDTNGICCKSNEPTACLKCCGSPPCCSTCIRCDVGDPLNDVFCGRNQQACPKGYHCQISPFDDTNGICCKSNGI